MRTLPGRLLSAVMLAAVAHTAPAAGAEAARPAFPAVAAAAASSAPPCGGAASIEERAAGERSERSERRVELLAPRAAIPLVAGSTALLDWAPLPGLAALPAREEWEAFLSLDGGKSYAFRITPHLDSDLRRTLWEVPGVPSADVRLLLRFGDERRETAIELPQRFTIAAMAGPLLAVSRRAALAPGRGEAARPGDAGVVGWTEGSRRGGGQRQVIAATAALRASLTRPGPARDPVALTVRPAKTAARAPARDAAGSVSRRGSAATARARQAPAPPIDTMLQTSRLNE